MSANGIGEILKKLRRAKGLSQGDVAAIINKSDKTISAWETGYAIPDGEMLLWLCEIYEVRNINETFSSIKKAPAPVETDTGERKKNIVNLLHIFFVKAGYIADGNDLTDEQFKVARGIVDFLDAMFE